MKRTTKIALGIAAVMIAALLFIGARITGYRGDNGVSADFPDKPITLIVPYAAGGGTDTTARALAKAAEKVLGQPVIVLNRTGGGGSVGLMEGANARTDGYTVTFLPAELTILPHLGLLPITYEKFKPIAQTNFDPSAITVRAEAPWQTVNEFLDFAKAHPGELKMGNAGTGSIWHLAAVTLERETGVKFAHIPFEGAGPAVSALMDGFVDAVPVSPAEVKRYVDEGKLRTLAVNADKRSEALPEVPTLEEQTGIHVNFTGTWRGLAVPKDTPDAISELLAEAFIKGTEDRNFREAMTMNGLGLLVKDGKAFSRQLKESDDLFSRMIPELGLSRN
ncbi:tripartite-type tricarboxylate transporter receptor subunit TctC [Paenibacillus sp. PastF-1]|nr:tripartite-type tricarboxylate transporter receptor subunit TctC [Paenibacillus sp. PastF-2]MDF9847419.1 tripartite-type tricarboxylate transporter receptor subunit TctC [Paenibacillus sp. PastM-2]MDF9854004.1 tripartite-type tricarboxylate transporter receptor subunit TctC [Paenibacillus sp. PastF-1]MDH6479276.1 tripartite-type tricarboxylate transporter receptor subunit TctC [Paenibacillus sp. PastH-2]MDH6506988.1 tripartite-type tricarboxylate transporter receptor subunit TctC [Paenibacil